MAFEHYTIKVCVQDNLGTLCENETDTHILTHKLSKELYS